ncbi:MAG: Rid family hydrolase [Pseudomonadota bacterium]
MPRTPIVPASLKENYDTLHYAPATRAGDMVYTSGVIAALKEGEEGTDEQYAAAVDEALTQIDMILKEAGGSMDDVVDITSYHINMMSNLFAMARIKDKWMPEPYPSLTAIGVAELYDPLGFVEIRVSAYIPQ